MKTRMVVQTKDLLISILIFIVLILVGCSKDDDTADNNPNSDAGVNSYLVDLPPWNSFSPTIPNSNEESEPVVGFDCENKIIETTTECSITRTPQEIVTHDPGSEILYLGSLIQGDGYIGGLGSIKSLPIYQRAPITVSISFQMADNSRIVENPSLSTIKSAIGDLVETAHNQGHVSGSSIWWEKSTCHSVEQTTLALGLSFKFMKSSIASDLQWASTSESSTVSAYFIQKMFTVSMGIPQRPSDLFSDDFTQELLDEQISLGRIGANNLPVYVSNIVYGRLMMLTMTSTYEETEMKAALEASYNNLSGSVSAEHLEILENSEIELVTIGGEQSSALGFLRTGELGEFFKDDAPLTTAVPISYTLRNLGDNEIAVVSETTEYDMNQYDLVSVEYYDTEEEWRNDAQYSGMALHEWDFNNQTLWLANESAGFASQSNGQTFMGTMATYSQDSTGFPFDFYLKNVAVSPTAAGSEYALVYKDQEGFTYQISVGDIDDWEDDDFEVGVSGSNVYAIGLTVYDNSAYPEEFLEVFAFDESGECFIDQINDPITGFVGIISPIPLKRIWFNEDAGGDDIAVDNFTFGVK